MRQRLRQLRPATVDLGARVFCAAIVFIVLSIAVPDFATSSNIYATLETAYPVGLVAVGVATTILAGELDLSAGAVATVAGVLVIRFISVGAIPMILLVVVGFAIYGCLQGYIIARLQIPSIVFTLGTMILMGGVEYEVSNQQIVYLVANQLSVSNAVRTQILIFSPASLTFIAVTVAVGLLLGFTRIGREIYALGGAREESRIAGVPQIRTVVVAFTLSGSLAALAGALASLREGSAGPQAYDSLLLTAVTAALIGGISLYGGRGRIAGVLVGVLTLQFLVSALGLLSAPFWAAGFAEGALLLFFLVVELAQTKSPLRQALERRLLAHRQRQEAAHV